jgi:quercetin dioxygenase-like cupin family protein/thiol-disulfide isomerase/thioredoxin
MRESYSFHPRLTHTRIHARNDCRRGARPVRAACASVAIAVLASLVFSSVAGGAAASDAIVAPLITRDLIGMAGKEVTMETVEYTPGAKSPPHRHHAQVFVYVLEGSVRMQVQGSPAVTLGPGGTFYESPDDLHVVSENASQTKPAKFLVVMVKDKGMGADGKVDESGQGRAEAAGRPLLGLPAPDIVLKTIDGKTVDLSKFYGSQPVYLKFWATWCVPCREQMPGFERDYERFGDRVAFVAVNAGFNDTEAAVRQVQREAGMRMPIVIDDGRLAADLNLRVTPQHVVIGRDGRILYIGHLADERLHDAMEEALRQAPRTASRPEMPARAVFGVGDSPRGLTAITMNGEAFPLVGASSDARPRALVFFSPWCESYLAKSRPTASQACRRVREEMNDLAMRHDARWLGIASGLWASAKDLADYQKEPGTPVPLTLDASGRLFRAFGVHSVPTVVLLDAQGRIAAKLGPNDHGLEPALRALEAKKQAS